MGGGGVRKTFYPVLGGGGARVSDLRFTHFVAPPPLPRNKLPVPYIIRNVYMNDGGDWKL